MDVKKTTSTQAFLLMLDLLPFPVILAAAQAAIANGSK
jgi:hypothetical protein